jgi:hypothetical protein
MGAGTNKARKVLDGDATNGPYYIVNGVEWLDCSTWPPRASLLVDRNVASGEYKCIDGVPHIDSNSSITTRWPSAKEQKTPLEYVTPGIPDLRTYRQWTVHASPLFSPSSSTTCSSSKDGDDKEQLSWKRSHEQQQQQKQLLLRMEMRAPRWRTGGTYSFYFRNFVASLPTISSTPSLGSSSITSDNASEVLYDLPVRNRTLGCVSVHVISLLPVC